MILTSTITRLASLLLLMSLMSTVLGAWIDTNNVQDGGEDRTDETVNTEEPFFNSPRQHKIPSMTRIIGGQPAKRGEIPWQARLEVAFNDGTIGTCGATIINKDWLLSAAHCFLKKNHILIRVRIFVGDIHVSHRDEWEQMFETYQPIIHEHYNSWNYDNDIALIKIRPTYDGWGIRFNSYVKQIQLPDSKTYVEGGTPCLTSGWGYYHPGIPQISEKLRAGDVKIISQQECRGYFPLLTGNMICAADIQRGIGTCSGDSGGPLVCNVGGVYTIIGVTSFGRNDTRCGAGYAPSVFANVPALRQWIRSKIGL